MLDFKKKEMKIMKKKCMMKNKKKVKKACERKN